MVHISANFDSGNIEIIDKSNPYNLQLKIRKDAGKNHFQWFYFRVTDAAGSMLRIRLLNAGEASYPDGWLNYQACYSYDRKIWRRIESTSYKNGVLEIINKPISNSVYYAYFAPYSVERHHDLIAVCNNSPRIEYQRLGATIEGQDIDLLHISEGKRKNKRQCWFLARQHAGESMAEWFMEGLLNRFLDPDDVITCALLTEAEFWIVPNMNLDGTRRGYLRNNAVGADLNREWIQPSMKRSPEVYCVREKMKATGLDFALDIHGDESRPYNYIVGPDKATQYIMDLQNKFKSELAAVNPDFQDEYFCINPESDKSSTTIAINWITGYFGKLSMILEQPFKDNINTPNAEYGWSPKRCRQLGKDSLIALYKIIKEL